MEGSEFKLTHGEVFGIACTRTLEICMIPTSRAPKGVRRSLVISEEV